MQSYRELVCGTGAGDAMLVDGGEHEQCCAT